MINIKIIEDFVCRHAACRLRTFIVCLLLGWGALFVCENRKHKLELDYKINDENIEAYQNPCQDIKILSGMTLACNCL